VFVSSAVSVMVPSYCLASLLLLLLLLLLFIQGKKRHKPVSPVQYKRKSQKKNHITTIILHLEMIIVKLDVEICCRIRSDYHIR